ncbi:MAG: response regulator transcription factor, partial [Candidatus Sulfotelmatobacter sp.]
MISKPANEQSAFKKKTVFVVDDHPIVRQGLTLLIDREADLSVCGEAEEMHSALRAIPILHPDILIVDISLNGPDGLELLKNVRITWPRLPVLVLSMHDESIYAERALRAGANGYIMKQEATEKVLVALRRILSGEIYVSSRIANSMLQHYVRGASPSEHSSISE